MTFVRKSYNDIVDSILSQITRGIVNEKFEYVAVRPKYRLEYPGAQGIVKVEGTVNGARFLFTKGIDFTFSENSIEWLDKTRPDNHTPFTVYYTIDVPTGITDVNPGSVTRNIVESIAIELDFLYAQMNQVYNSSYIDTASGKALDLVVALLGITRKPAGFAAGEVTFGRNKEPGLTEAPKEALIFDGKGKYQLKSGLVEGIKSVDGEVDGSRIRFTEGTDYRLMGDAIAWMPGGRHPNPGSVYYVDYSVYEKIAIPSGTTVSTYSRNPANVKSFRTTRDVTLDRNAEGRWEVEVPVVALVPGREGNVFLGSINVMPKPVPGIEFVINKHDILSGSDVESDADLRERAKRALEKAGKATLRSLKSAVQGVEGVMGEVVIIDQPDGVPGIIQIIASGGDPREIERIIDDTRSAGIHVEFKRPTTVMLDIRLMVAVEKGVDTADARARVDLAVRNYLGTLNIGDDVMISRIIEAALSVAGVIDAREVTINDKKDNVHIREDERGEYRTVEVFLEA
ncbi:MAG TPA: baseplate J/gp47 family protein [Methanocella sp.]|uniref:baseplate J/gp47 family protein n=1 Tax=Methanocella sp. TaxID=2052833 RepID=UPI002C6982BA|nr:baseplate J/gp47 family protein [Methanocella sp.]HTY90422.1 baseplate J/gp47 family protein [Methanocella sp.]